LKTSASAAESSENILVSESWPPGWSLTRLLGFKRGGRAAALVVSFTDKAERSVSRASEVGSSAVDGEVAASDLAGGNEGSSSSSPKRPLPPLAAGRPRLVGLNPPTAVGGVAAADVAVAVDPEVLEEPSILPNSA